MRRHGVEFHDLGDQYLVQRDKTRLANRLLQRLRDLGVEVESELHEERGNPDSFS